MNSTVAANTNTGETREVKPITCCTKQLFRDCVVTVVTILFDLDASFSETLSRHGSLGGEMYAGSTAMLLSLTAFDILNLEVGLL